MYYIYIIKSEKDGKLYIGSTSNIRRRFYEHNKGSVLSTRFRRPFKLIYLEGYLSKEDAFHREHNLKLGARARRQLMIRIVKSLASF